MRQHWIVGNLGGLSIDKGKKSVFYFCFWFLNGFGFVSYFMGITPCNIQISIQFVPGDF